MIHTHSSLTLYPLEHAIQEGRYQDALRKLEALLDVVPEHVEAQEQLARLVALMRRSGESAGAYGRGDAPTVSW